MSPAFNIMSQSRLLCRTIQPALHSPQTLLRNYAQVRFFQTSPFGRGPRHQRFDSRSGILASLFSRWVRGPTFKRDVGIMTVGAGGFYWYNIEEVPVSGRRRFNCISRRLEERLGQASVEQVKEEYKRAILPAHDPRVQQVKKVLDRLVPFAENEGMKGTNWEIFVIDSAEENAFVTPGGKVFFFTGILPICKDENGIAAVLGHEIAHVVARHTAEKISQAPLILIPVAFTLLFDFSFSMGAWLLDLFLSMPASRKQEAEADFIGLMMMAQGCYNPEAAAEFWARMERMVGRGPPQFLSTHPSHQNREAKIHEWLPKAWEKADTSDCHMINQYADQFSSTSDSLGRW